MKNKFNQMIFGTIVGFLIVLGSTMFLVSGQELKNESTENSIGISSNRTIEGTWQTFVTPRNCQSGASVAPAFPGLLTFNAGGTLTGTSTAVSSVYGVWRRGSGSHAYSFAFISLRYSADGTFLGTQEVRQTAEISARGNDFTTTGTVEVFDANNNLVSSGCATSTGTRFE